MLISRIQNLEFDLDFINEFKICFIRSIFIFLSISGCGFSAFRPPGTPVRRSGRFRCVAVNTTTGSRIGACGGFGFLAGYGRGAGMIGAADNVFAAAEIVLNDVDVAREGTCRC